MENLLHVNEQLNRKDLFDAFKIQLSKDFLQSNFSADFVEALVPDYARLHEAILQELQRSSKGSSADVMKLLYRVDISEAQLKRYLNKQPDEHHLNTIAELIIKRVLQKVVIKEFYRRGNP